MKRFIAVILLPGFLFAQTNPITLSGLIKSKNDSKPVPYVNVQLKNSKDSQFVAGTVTSEEGRFTITGIKPGNYYIECSFTGYVTRKQPAFVGSLATFLDVGSIELDTDSVVLGDVIVGMQQDTINNKMDKQTLQLSNVISQQGGSLLEALKTMPGVTVGQDGKVQLRGNDRVTILVDGRQTALTGFGGQSGLDNIPVSAIDRVEIIHNPSARYEANGNAGIINIIYKKERKEGVNGKVGLSTGLGALWIKKENLPGIRAQYRGTPKVNPSFAFNYRKKKVNFFFQGDELFTKTLNKNEFVDRYYDTGELIRQQTKRNRNSNIIMGKTGFDWYADNNNSMTVSGLFSREKIIDHGDEPFYNHDLTDRLRLWQFLEDEVKTTVTASAVWQHHFNQPGRTLNMGVNYTFHREDEKYFFTNYMPAYTGLDSFKLLSDEHVADVKVDYVQPLKAGRLEAGIKFQRRYIPTNMRFKPGLNSPLDINAGGWANYGETIPAIYGNYIYESKTLELETGLRMEYVRLRYNVNPDHNTYTSDGYHYTQPFPALRMAYKISGKDRITLFYNRRVDRPNEVDIRIFPKYDDAEIIKVGNPGLRPQYTNSYELGYKTDFSSGTFTVSLYHKRVKSAIARIGSTVPGSPIIYNVFQNAGLAYNTGIEILLSGNFSKWGVYNVSLSGYKSRIDAFTVTNKYPVEHVFSAGAEEQWAGNIKLNGMIHLGKQWDWQTNLVYLSPDLIPQGRTRARFYIDMGLRKKFRSGRDEFFINASDIANTSVIKKRIKGDGFNYTSTDYAETQVIRIGYSRKF